ncbi:unnamed protein product, partial [Meganyctiphanes norvegica]
VHTASPQPSQPSLAHHKPSNSFTMNPHNSTFKALLVTVLAIVALASQTRHYGSSNLGLGNLGVGLGFGSNVGAGLGLGGVGGIGGVGSVGGLGGGYGSSGSCRYWCRTPQGQAYCCEGGNEVASLPTVKPGQCPPVRPQC